MLLYDWGISSKGRWLIPNITDRKKQESSTSFHVQKVEEQKLDFNHRHQD